jgi:transcriptional regulator with XRE-family HTH domain
MARTFGDLLVKARGERGQHEIAEALDVSQPTISDWETQAHLPRKSRLKKIAKAYGVEFDSLVDAWLRSETKAQSEAAA